MRENGLDKLFCEQSATVRNVSSLTLDWLGHSDYHARDDQLLLKPL
jgi:hypothetical protein